MVTYNSVVVYAYDVDVFLINVEVQNHPTDMDESICQIIKCKSFESAILSVRVTSDFLRHIPATPFGVLAAVCMNHNMLNLILLSF